MRIARPLLVDLLADTGYSRIDIGPRKRGLVAVVALAALWATPTASAAPLPALPVVPGIDQNSPLLEAVSDRRWNRRHPHRLYGHRGHRRAIIVPYAAYRPYYGGAYIYGFPYAYTYGFPYSYGYGDPYVYGYGRRSFRMRESGESKRGD